MKQVLERTRLKIYLAEDEFIVREGIKKIINWDEEGFDFCGEAADGELAYQGILEHRPDILITDIKMPFMNGLELSRLVRKELPKTKIIIISGHEEFKYAHEALQIGVTEYLLKPINSGMLLKVVKKVASQIEDESTEDSRKKLFVEILEGHLSLTEIYERAENLDIEIRAKYYQIIIGKVINSGSHAFLATFFDNDKYVDFFNREIEGFALLVKGDSIECVEERSNSYVVKVNSECKDVLVGRGAVVERLSSLRHSYEEASRQLAKQYVSQDKDDFKITDLGKMDFDKVEMFLKTGELEAVACFVETYFIAIGEKALNSLVLRQYLVLNMHLLVLNIMDDLELEDLDDIFKITQEISRVRDYITVIFKKAIQHRDKLRSHGNYRIIEEAKKFMHEKYQDDGMSLLSVASYVNMSANHFSTIFSKETGTSFIKYLTDIRMNQAKVLLKGSDLSCAQIGLAVGYKDPQYFSYIFKKIENCTPMQFRVKP